VVVLATTLPGKYHAAHWPAAWVGLDTLEAVGLITTGLLALRGDRRLPSAATATATLLAVDAWFDMTTSPTWGDFRVAWSWRCAPNFHWPRCAPAGPIRRRQPQKLETKSWESPS
jgi:hypothetical protein